MAEHQVMLEEYSNWFSGGGGETGNDSEEVPCLSALSSNFIYCRWRR